MIKKTFYFGNPAYLSLKDNQLVIRFPEVEKSSSLPEKFKQNAVVSKPIEDIGIVILDNKQLTLTAGLIDALLQNNCAVITCDNASMPTGLLLPLSCNTVQSERFRFQIDASLPLLKQLWQQTVKSKIENQRNSLKRNRPSVETACLSKWIEEVRSGDADNMEARAAVYYWKNFFPIEGFSRSREGMPPNALLNYGYAILRAVVARALVASGLLPTLGIHHHNKYNAYCLADDIMEPYRPFVDDLIYRIVVSGQDYTVLNKDIKSQLLQIPALDVQIAGCKSPLMLAVAQTTASLYKCFSGELRKISYPEFSDS